jgi:ferredoxin
MNKPEPAAPLSVFFGGSVAAAKTRVRIRVNVNRNHCHLYAICEQEAPEVFHLSPDGRLEYKNKPHDRHLEAVRQAARLCPMQAIEIEERQR